MMKKLHPKTKNEDSYIRLFQMYIHRPVFYLLLVVTICLAILLFQKQLMMLWYSINQGKSIPTFSYNAGELANYEGEAIILNKDEEKVYEGMFRDGACNGVGKLYRNGSLYYKGNFKDNAMEDENAVEYVNDIPTYYGGYKDNRRCGKGIELYKNGLPKYNGEFDNNAYQGVGIIYDEKGNLVYEGDFEDGKRHGQGILYADGSNNRWRYKGSFAFDLPQGEGTFFDVYGKPYFTGIAYMGQINFTALLPCSLEELEKHYVIPYDYVLVNGITAIVYKNQKIAFTSQYPIEFVEDEKSRKLVVDEHVKKKDIILNRIIMADDDVDLSDPNNFTMEHVRKGWQEKYVPVVKAGRMDEEDILAIYMTENKAFKKEKKAISLIEKGNRIYELEYHKALDFRKRIVYQADTMNIIYGFPIYQDQLLYSLMRGIEMGDDDKEVNLK